MNFANFYGNFTACLGTSEDARTIGRYSESDIKNGIINALSKENLSLGEIKERYPQLDRVVSEENREQALQQAKTVDNSVEQEIAKEKQMDNEGSGFGA